MGVSKSRLSDNDRARLDTIVQKMVANNESDSDIQLVVEDFKTKYSTNDDEPVKKKEVGSMASQFGGQAGASGGRSITRDEEIADLLENKVGKSMVEPTDKGGVIDPVATVNGIIEDPVKSILDPLRKKHSEIQDQELGMSGRAVAESTKQANYGDRTQINMAANLPGNLRSSRKKIETQIDNKMSELWNMFSDGRKAVDYLHEKARQNGGQLPDNNETVQLAASRAARYIDLKKEVTPENFTQVAVDLARKGNPLLNDQIATLEKGAGWDFNADNVVNKIPGYSRMSPEEQQRVKDRVAGSLKKGMGAYTYENIIPKNVQGFYVDQLLHDPDIQIIASENPALKAQVEYLKNGGLYERFPEYGEYIVRNTLSKEYEKRRSNIVANPIFNNSKYLDNLADEVFANNPALKKIADKMKGHWEGKIDTKGIVDELGTGAKHTFGGMLETGKDWLGAGKTQDERIYKGLEEEYGQVSSGVKGWQKDLGHASNFGGMILAMGAAGAPLKIMGMGSVANNVAITGLTFWDDEKNKYIMAGYPEWKSNYAASLSTLAFLLAPKAIPGGKVGEAIMGKMEPEIKEALASMEKGPLTAAAKDNLVQRYAKILKGTGKGVAEGISHMEAITAFQVAIDRMTDMNPQSFSQLHPDNQYEEVARSMAIGLLAPSLLTAYASRNAAGINYKHISENPLRYLDAIDQAKQRGEITEADYNQKVSDIDYLSSIRKPLEGKTDKQIGKALAASLYKKRLQDEIKGVPDRTIVADKETEIKATEIEQEQILNPDLSNEEIIEKLKKAGALPNDAAMILYPKNPETGKEEFKPENLDGYLEMVAQQVNGFDPKWQPYDSGVPEPDNFKNIPAVIIEMANTKFAKKIINSAKAKVKPEEAGSLRFSTEKAAQPKEELSLDEKRGDIERRRNEELDAIDSYSPDWDAVENLVRKLDEVHAKYDAELDALEAAQPKEDGVVDLSKPQRFTLNQANKDLPQAPEINKGIVDWEKSGMEDNDIVRVKLLEARGKNSNGVSVGTVMAWDKDSIPETYEVFFKAEELPEGNKVPDNVIEEHTNNAIEEISKLKEKRKQDLANAEKLSKDLSNQSTAKRNLTNGRSDYEIEIEQIEKGFNYGIKRIKDKYPNADIKAVEDLLGKKEAAQPKEDALKDVESTKKALKALLEVDRDALAELHQLAPGITSDRYDFGKENALTILSKEYHRVKEDGSNPEFVKAVEDLLGKKEAAQPKEDALKDVESTAKALDAGKIKQIEAKKTEIEKRRQEELKPYNDRDNKSIEAVMPNNPNHPIFKVGDKYDYRMKIIIINSKNDDNYDGREPYTVITKILKPAEVDSDGVMTKAAEVETTLFNTKEEADKAIKENYEKIKSLVGKKQETINAKYDAELIALENKSPVSEDLLGKEPAVGDIESTTKSLVDVAKNNPEKFADFKSAIDEYPDEEGIDISTPQGAKEMSSIIAEEYHKAKKDGSNPELIKSVDDAIKQEGSKGAKPVAAEEKGQPEKGTGTTGEKTESKRGVSPKIKKKLEAFKEKHLSTNTSQQLRPLKELQVELNDLYKKREEYKRLGKDKYDPEAYDAVNKQIADWESSVKKLGGKVKEEVGEAKPVIEEVDTEEVGPDKINKGLNPKDFKKGDRVKDVFNGKEYEILESDKKGMAKLKDLETGRVHDYNAHNNPHFEKLEDKPAPKPEIKTEGPKSIRLGGKDYKPIGKNSEGKELFENEEGIRAVASDSKGIYKNEPVSIIPTKEGIEYSANRREEYMTTDELKIKANKKLSELMPGLSGEKEVEEEIKAKNGIQEKRDTIIKEHNAKVDELKKSAKPIQREIPDAKDFKPGFRFLNYDPEATRNGGIVEFEVVIGNHVDANGQTSREGDYYFKAKNLRTGKDVFFNTKEHLRDIQHQTRMFNNDLEPADKSKEIAALKKETDAKLAALTESEPKAQPKTASSKPVEPPKEVKRKIRDEQLKRDIDKGWDDFLSDSDLLKSGPLDPKKIEAGTKLVGLYIKGGVYKFSDILEDAYAKFGDKLHEFVDALKAVYGAFRDVEATDEQAAQMDTNLRGIKLDDIIKNLKNETDNRGTGDAEKPSVVPPVDGVGKEPAQGDGAGHEEGGVSGVGDKESRGGTKTTGPSGKEDGAGPGRGDSEGKHDVALNGNDQLNADLGGTTQEQPISKPEEQKPVVAPVQHNENFIVPPDFAHEKSFNVGKRLQDNIDAIKILIKLKEEDRKPTYEEQKALFKYVGWGGIKEIGFDPKSDNGWSPSNSHLKKQIAEVSDLLQQLYPQTHKENLAAIKSSVLNAHYTAIPVIRGMWDIIRKGGFKGGNVLEPSAGVGHFIGAMPIDFIEKSRIIGIELDPLTSEVLKGLYPNHIIRNAGYEETKVGNNVADLVISNIPFGNYKVFDKEFIKSKDPILRKAANKVHTYFFARALQDVKPNGLVAFVTTTGVMDAKDNRELRQMIEERAEFLGAIRLPNDAFRGNANTQVTTDIIFLRKFGDTEKPVQKHSFLDSQSVKVKHKDKDQMFNVSYNEYFHKNPEMVLGEVEAGSMYGASRDGLNDAMTVSPKYLDIQAEMTKLADKIFSKESSEKRETQKNEAKETAETFVKSNGERVGNLVEISDGVYGISKGEKEDGTTEVEPIRVAKKYEGAVKDMIQIRAALNNLYAAEYGDLPHIESKRAWLNTVYKDFVKRNGTLQANKNLLEMDVDGHNMLALEKTEGKNVVGLADIFTKRVFQPREKITKAKDLADAITINLNETGGVDIDRISELLKITPEQAIEQSKGLLFKNPQGGFETKDKYLSGNVRKKLEDAKIAANEDPFYEQNVKALEEVQPQDLNAAQIYAPISASWINPTYVTDFASELLKQNIRLKRLSTGKVTVDGAMKYSTEVTDEFGTSRMDAFKIMEEVIQNRMPIVKDYTDDGKAIVNEAETQKAIQKAEKIKQAFDNWVWKDDDRRNDLVKHYNENFNNTVIRNYDGSHLVFDGFSGYLTPKKHQLDGVWMVMQQMNGILDHIVGSGKSLIMVLASKKMKESGLIKKPIILGLKANTADLAETYRKSFPMAKVLSPTEKDFSPENRKAFFAKMANNDWDAIIMTHDQFGMIEQPREIKMEIIQEEIDALEADIRDAKDHKLSKMDLNNLEKRKLNLRVKLQTLLSMTKDESLKSFEDMGVDFMFVDESQMFKNLAYNTIQRGVAGLGSPLGSNKAFNMLVATRHLQKMYGADKGTVFASGTPISNTMVEMYLLFKYLRPNKMAEMGIKSFDQWANTFARVGSEIEFGVTNSLKPKTRMREFMNVPEMAAMYREIADVRNDSNLDLDKPEFKKTIRIKTDKDLPANEIVTIGEQKFKVIGRIKGVEKNEFWVSLKAIGKDPKIPSSGTVLHGDKTINYKDIEYSDGLLVNITPTVEQRRFAKRIQRFAETKDGSWIGRPGLSEKEEKAYMLLATNLASKMAIDMRLVDPRNESSEVGKIAVAADSIVDHYKESEKHKGIQLVFSDLGTPKSVNTPENLFNLIESRGVDRDTLENIFGKSVYNDKPKYPSVKELKSKMQSILEYTDAEFEDAVKEANEDNFNVYQEMKDKLVKRGIPADEIAFIHDYKSDRQRKELFSNARAGKIRVIIGSTSKLGTGVNVQDKIVALHHLDVPWRPSDMEQRNGRGIRQGNLVIKNNYDNELPVYMYATESTLDAYKYQLLSTKQQFIDQAKSTDLTTREISEGEGDEENGVSFAAMTAMLSGNPVILEKAKIDKKVKELDSAKKAFQQEKYTLKDKIANAERLAKYYEELKKQHEQDKEEFDKNAKKDAKTGEYIYEVSLDGTTLKDEPKKEKEKEGEESTVRQKANEKIYELLKAGKTGKIGSMYGFDIVIDRELNRDKLRTVSILGPSGHTYKTFQASAFSDGRGSSSIFREILGVGEEVGRKERYKKLELEDAESKRGYFESLPEEFPKEKEYADAIEKQKQIQARLTEMSQQEQLPDVEEVKSLGRKIDGSFDEISSRLNEGENNIYAVTEDNIVLRIKDPAEVEDAISKNSQFYTYEGEKLGGKSSEEEEDGADYQVKEQQSADITDMQDIVKDMVREGKSSLEDIQKTVAEELGDSSKKMRDLVESAYHEYGKSDATRPEQKGIAKAVAKRVGQSLSKMFGGSAKSKVEVLEDSDALMEKADELGGGNFHVIKGKPPISSALRKWLKTGIVPLYDQRDISQHGVEIKIDNIFDKNREGYQSVKETIKELKDENNDEDFSSDSNANVLLLKHGNNYEIADGFHRVARAILNGEKTVDADIIESSLYEPKFMKSPDGKVLGFTKDGKIYLNGEHLNPNTPVHEAGHVWVDYVEKEKPAIYKKGVDLLSSERGNAYLQKAKDSKFYQEEAAKLPADQREAYFQKEALAMAIGDKGAQFVTEATKKGFREWLKTLWGSVKSALGFKDITPEELADLTFDEFTKRAARDILSGEKTFEKERTETGEGETVGITHRATDELAKEMGLPDEYEKDPEQVAEWDAEAKQNIDEGKMPALIAKLKKGDMPDKVEQRMMLQYMAGIKAEYNRNPSDEILNHYREIKKLSDIVGGRDVAKSLVARKGMTEVHPLEGGILDALDAKMEALGVETLTDTQKQEMEALVKEYEKRAKNAEKKLKDLQAKKAQEDAENEIKKARNSKSSYKPKTHEERVAERDSIKEKARKALEALRSGAGGFSAVPAPGVRELIAIAPHVKDYVRSLAAEGLDNLHQAVIKVKDFFDDILEMEESDIRDIIAGVHDESKPTQNEAAARWRDLQAEAGLLKQIEDVYNGVPKTEKERVQRNQRIKDLQDKLRKLKKDEGYDALDNLKSKIRRNKEEAAKIRERIANKDFAPPKNTSVFSDRKLQYKYPAEYKAMLDALAEKENAKHDFDIALFRDELSRASKAEKVTNFLTKLTGTVKAIVTGIDDSAVAVQTYMALLLRPRTAATALKLHVEFAASQKKFNRWLTEVHNSPDYELIKNSGLNITEPQSLKAAEKEEIFSDRFNGTVKFKGKEYKLIDAPLKPFERAFTTLGNVTRLMAFRAKADAYYRKGYTFESHPELFKSLAQRLNTETGRGKENEYVERASKVVTMGIWSPKLMASKFNILGVSDFSSIVLSKSGTKGYYRQLHPTERVEAIKDVAKFMVGVVAITYGAALAFGGQVDTDPLSPTFLDVKFQNGKRYNFTGGFSRYFAQIYQFIRGRQKIDGEVKSVNRITRQLPNFFRKKMPPVSSAIFGSFSGRNAIGKKTTPENEAIHLLQPMSVQGIVKQIQEDGASSLFLEGIPTFMGFNISSDKDFQKKETVVDPQTFEKRDKTQDEIKNEKELTTSNYADLMKKYRDNKLPIYMDKNGEVHLADPEMTDEALAFNITRKGWKKITFDKLNDQRQKFESKVKAKAKDAAQKKVYGVTLTEE